MPSTSSPSYFKPRSTCSPLKQLWPHRGACCHRSGRWPSFPSKSRSHGRVVCRQTRRDCCGRCFFAAVRAKERRDGSRKASLKQRRTKHNDDDCLWLNYGAPRERESTTSVQPSSCGPQPWTSCRKESASCHQKPGAEEGTHCPDSSILSPTALKPADARSFKVASVCLHQQRLAPADVAPPPRRNSPLGDLLVPLLGGTRDDLLDGLAHVGSGMGDSVDDSSRVRRVGCGGPEGGVRCCTEYGLRRTTHIAVELSLLIGAVLCEWW